MATQEAWVPPEPSQRRELLIEFVRESHPLARPKSFADDVASFVDPTYLIVAWVGDEASAPRGQSHPSSSFEQDALFEDVA